MAAECEKVIAEGLVISWILLCFVVIFVEMVQKRVHTFFRTAIFGRLGRVKENCNIIWVVQERTNPTS